ncbi:energy-coupling factor transport system substrate-specific component [Saccharopolyspora kobensis]|uniref:Energy-coupling factor transport system substrate-specific component n=2 Tax=Saccharopolyspora kobensis TaxID=146035 RepID=A0A1H6A581_9PSEU|nr:MptD family putative ECF transporter S component [Saccharopolyspora kobensis]SEG43364.1 energy-coupling factor transport system substrate-specific component [Saccharopolyspora kobensis]SFE19337.1 energy-coupling factor transport system substrate-specific component [Saccharopolyspora kobensis]
MITVTVEATDRRIDFRMSPRDLINIGIFGALYLVTVGVFNALEFINPGFTLVSVLIGIVAGGVPFMLFLTRVRHAGMVTVLAVIVSGFMLLIGSPPVTIVVAVVAALAAEALLWAGRYRSRRFSVLAYAVFSTWFVGMFLPMFYARADFLTSPYMKEMGAEYVQQLDALLSPVVLIAFDLSTLVVGFLGGLLGLRLLDKHFRKAGLV